MYGEDAKTAASLLKIHLTSKEVPTLGRVELCGVPAYALEQYTETLQNSHNIVLASIDQDSGKRTVYALKQFHQQEKEAQSQDHSATYQLLSRLKQDCDYYLGAGNRNNKHLWAETPQAQLEKMRELYDLLPEKPEWLTEQDLDRYEKEMLE